MRVTREHSLSAGRRAAMGRPSYRSKQRLGRAPNLAPAWNDRAALWLYDGPLWVRVVLAYPRTFTYATRDCSASGEKMITLRAIKGTASNECRYHRLGESYDFC